MIAYGALATWRRDGTFGAWLTRIAVRIALRRAQRRKPVTWIEPGDPDRRAVRPRRRPRSRGGRRSGRSATARVRAAVAQLDEPYRETVSLRFFGELSLAEIAAADRAPASRP